MDNIFACGDNTNPLRAVPYAVSTGKQHRCIFKQCSGRRRFFKIATPELTEHFSNIFHFTILFLID
ncbi:hypothetical protein [Flavobacterium supellecticarium]|uniref:hypothetical protein n=1 Tax=Flavobacterium supellecticarium TaxID=2565924 RepID=UPI001E36322C|nr:hypothetical protein [Flavobacterium supellecticarium]